MFSKLHNTVTYSNKSWTDVENRYDLLQPMELVIKEENSAPGSIQKLNTSNAPSWALRLLMLAGFTAIIGNVPLQSQLLNNNSANTLATSFEIKTNSDTTNYSLASLDVNKDEYIDIEAVEILDTEPTVIEFDLPERALETYVGNVIDENESKWFTYHVKSYDNPTNIFHKIGHQNLLKPFEKIAEIEKNIKALKKGSIVRAKSNDGELKELIFTHGNKDSFVITKKGDSYEGSFKNNVLKSDKHELALQ